MPAWSSVRACLAVVCLAGAAAPLMPDDGPDETALAMVAQIDAALDAHDAEAIQDALRRLEGVYAQVGDKTLKKVLKAVGQVFREFKPRIDAGLPVLPPAPGDTGDEVILEDPRVEILACYRMAVGLMYDKPQGADVLLPVLKLPHVKNWPEVVALIVQGLGYRQDPTLTKAIAPWLAADSAALASAAAAALGQLHEKPVEARREAVAALVDEFQRAYDEAAKEARKLREGDAAPAADRLASMQVAFTESLTMLTRATCADPPAWSAWFSARGRESDW